MTTQHVLELAVCTVKDMEAAIAARKQAMSAVSCYPGFVSWRAATACETADVLADLVEWETLDVAQAAGRRVMTDPEFAPYLAAISSVQLCNHFRTEQQL